MANDFPEKPKRGDTPAYPQARIMAALVLIGLGVLFMLQQYGFKGLDNWWALFILIPGIAALGRGMQLYRAAGELTPSARNSLTGATLMILVGAIFLFNLDWGKLLPVVLILPGVFMLLGNLGRSRE